MLFGPLLGGLADKYGRKQLSMVFCLIYTLSCLMKVSVLPTTTKKHMKMETVAPACCMNLLCTVRMQDTVLDWFIIILLILH